MSRSPLIEIPVSPFLTPVESPVAKPSLKRPLTPGETVLSPSKRRILVAEGILQPDFKAKRSARGNTHETKSRTMPGIVGVLLESPDIVTRPKAGASSSSTSRTTSPRSHTSKPYATPPTPRPSSSDHSPISYFSLPINRSRPGSSSTRGGSPSATRLNHHHHHPGFDIFYDPDSLASASTRALSVRVDKYAHEEKENTHSSEVDGGNRGRNRHQRARSSTGESRTLAFEQALRSAGDSIRSLETDGDDVVMLDDR